MTAKYALHHFFNFEPDSLGAINSLAVNDDLKKLAVLRKSSSMNPDEFQPTTIEIWNYENNNTFFVEQRIYDDYKQPQLAEAIAWGKDNRLFTVGLNEKLNEISLSRGCIKRSYQIVSGPAYCMKFNKSRELLVVGTDHGYICIFNICESSKRNEVALDKNLKITSKVFSIDWFERSDETLIVASTTEQIRIFDYKTGLQRDVIKLDLKDCHIWSVCVLPDPDEFVIISGDSNGSVTFWDGLTCTQIASLKLHKNDVNAICAKNEKRAFSLGIDGRLCKFSYLNGRVIVQGNQQYVSDYELKSIASSEVANCLFVGSVDSEIKRADPASQSVKRHPQEFGRLIHNYDRYLMYQYERSLKLWKLDDETADQPIYLGAILSKKEIISSAINRKYIVFSDFHKTTVLSRKDDKFVKLGTIQNAQFGSNLQSLVLLKNSLYVQTPRSVHRFDLSKFKASGGQSLESGRIKFKNRIFKVLLSRNFIAIIFESSQVEFYDLELSSNVASLEAKSLPLIGEWQSDSILWLITNDNLYIIYDVVNKKVLRSNGLQELLGKAFSARTSVEGLTFTEHSTVVYTKSRIWSISHDTGETTANLNYKNIVRLAKLNENEFYLVELLSENLLRNLPPTVFRKRFGMS